MCPWPCQCALQCQIAREHALSRIIVHFYVRVIVRDRVYDRVRCGIPICPWPSSIVYVTVYVSIVDSMSVYVSDLVRDRVCVRAHVDVQCPWPFPFQCPCPIHVWAVSASVINRIRVCLRVIAHLSDCVDQCTCSWPSQCPWPCPSPWPWPSSCSWPYPLYLVRFLSRSSHV